MAPADIFGHFFGRLADDLQVAHNSVKDELIGHEIRKIQAPGVALDLFAGINDVLEKQPPVTGHR